LASKKSLHGTLYITTGGGVACPAFAPDITPDHPRESCTVAKEKSKVRLMKASNEAPTAIERTFQTSVDIPADTRAEMIALLNQTLADTSDLYSQTKQAHWNVKGIHFYPLHLLFDQLAEKRIGEADDLAERATELGGYATGTIRMAAAASRLPEIPTDIDDGVDYVRALVERYALHANNTRSGIDQADKAGDMDTADLLTEISRELDKDLWFLQAHVQA
jgi:starvation-inducible DNA-binding protein